MSLSNRFWALARPSPIVRRALRDGLAVAGLAFAAYLFLVVAPIAGTFGFDAYAYWSLDLANPYAVPAGTFGAFTYTPVIARLFAPVGLLSWPAFVWLWSALLIGTVVWLGWRSALLLLAFPPVALELYHGNVHLLMAAAIALGFRYPVAWSFVLLTKVTPAVGLVWFAVRREWRPLAIAIGSTAALVVASLLIDGRLWAAWLDESILKTAGGAPLNQFSIAIPLVIRLPAGILLVAWGGLTDRRWTVPVAATLTLPILWPSGLAVLAALWPILQRRPELETRPGSPVS
jgi:glycosyl transferase family 87